ncbi:MAG TPA: tetratricopeptide repeat protein, partial [Bacteroidia bacterium]|nr:tetratricopeptide repeat protein [Bacteroidia bacterium]
MKRPFFYGWNRIILCIAISLLSGRIYCQDSSSRYSQLKGELMAHYLGDTLNAPAKIKELIRSAMESGYKDDKTAAIEKYQVAFALVPYARDSDDVLARLYAQFSGLLYRAGAEDMSIEYAKKSLVFRKKVHRKATIDQYNIIGKIASFYLESGRFDSATKYFEMGLREANELNTPLWKAAAMNNLGMLYQAENLHDTALSSYKNAINILALKNQRDSFLMGSINDNIARNFYVAKQFPEALEYFNRNNILYSYLHDTLGIIKSELGVASAFTSMRKFSEALSEIDNAEKIFQAKQAISRLRNMNTRINILKALQQFHSESGDWKKALDEENTIASIIDSLSKEQKNFADGLMRALTETEILKAHRDIEVYNLHLKEKENALEESRKTSSLRLIIAILVTIAGGFVIALLLLYFRNRNRIQLQQIKIREYKEELAGRELEKQKLEQEKLEQELHYKKGDLHDLGVYLSKVKDMHTTVSDKLEEIKNRKTDVPKEAIVSLLNELNSQIYSQQRLRVIQESIEQVNREFYDKLLRLYPELTKSELELC